MRRLRTVLASLILLIAAGSQAQVSGLLADFDAAGDVHLLWVASPGATSYEVYHNSDGVVAIVPGNLLGTTTVTSWDHTGALNTANGVLDNPHHHFYRVRPLVNQTPGTASDIFGVFHGFSGANFYFGTPCARPSGASWRASQVVKPFLVSPNSVVIDLSGSTNYTGGLPYYAVLSGVTLGGLDQPNGMQAVSAYYLSGSTVNNLPLWLSGKDPNSQSAVATVLPPACAPGITYHTYPVVPLFCPRSTCGLFTSPSMFIGGTVATSDRVVSMTNGQFFYYRSAFGTWMGTLTGCSAAVAYAVVNKHSNTWNWDECGCLCP